ncbi:Disease resistance protein (CC-NBS-LRR class) family [Rhynchospora pubera]|uniref:Disease resistance protein (CC-NBS-LRR class) family n=1 Tax=Rhynchospora pubera TaxID=906938 RepID=A0AAV8CNF9_9POAL|nr:Disease resistance protein (CC-NBS-LRR class) family [Rhynchospora pubera]
MRAFDPIAGVSVPTSICNLKDLQSLQRIEATRDLAENLKQLKLLKTLHLSKVQQCFMPELCASVAMLPYLTNLAISAINNDEVLNLNFLDPLPDLEMLHIRGRMEMKILPRVFDSFHKLRRLHLYWSGLKEDPLCHLAHMSNLVFLCLIKTYDGELLTFRKVYFPNIRDLILMDMAQLVAIEIEDGTMINLEYLQLTGLQGLKCVPEGLYFLGELQRVVLQDMPEAFVEKLRGEESRFIQHVPHVIYRD